MKHSLLLCLSLLLCSCTTNYSLPVFNLGRTVDPVCYQNDNWHLFLADGQWYVKGLRCTYRHYTHMDTPMPVNLIPFVDLGRIEEPWETMVEEKMEDVYIPIHPDSYADVRQLLNGKKTDRPLRLDTQHVQSSLPGKITRFSTPYMKTDYPWDKGKVRTSAHALWAYPLGVATAVVVDVPGSILANVLPLPAGVCMALTDAGGQQQAMPPIPTNTTTSEN